MGRGAPKPSPRLMLTPTFSTTALAMPATTATPATATPPPPTAASTTTARGALTPSPRLTPTTATMATPAPTAVTTATPAPTDTPTTAKCTKDLRISTGRRDLPTQQYSMKCDEPTITRSKLPKKRPAPCALSSVRVQSYHLLKR